jgi:PAS domain S-box-containing protein
MARVRLGIRYRELPLLVAVMATVLTLAVLMMRDLRQSADEAGRLYDRVAHGLDLIDQLQFNTQEVRRVLLYALYTSDANLQLAYVEQSRELDGRVQQLLDNRTWFAGASATERQLDLISANWREYLRVRDDVIGYILEGSLPDAVALDQDAGTKRFNAVREAIAALKDSFALEAAAEASSARSRAARTTERLAVLVLGALLTTAVGIYLINRRAALERLLAIEAHKGSILEAAPHPVISIDGRQRITEFNAAASRTFGITEADALGRDVEDVILPAGNRGALAAVLVPAAAGAAAEPVRVELTGVGREGRQFPMEVAAATHEENGRRMWALHLVDVSTYREAQRQLLDAKDAAEAATRAKTEFLATMSHELRTPLNAVIGAADLLQQARLPPAQRDLVRTLSTSARALLALVSDILDYTRIEAGLVDLVPVRFSLATCLDEALDQVAEAAAAKGLDLGYVIEPGVPPDIVADESRLRQILLNLLSNAVKFTASGEVAVVVRSMAPDETGKTRVSITVTDTGPGIPVAQQPRLFQRFAQLESGSQRTFAGAGLGLAISHRLSRLLGGGITVESEVGRGSSFTVAFDAQAAGPAAEPRPVAGLAGKRAMALLRPGVVARQVASLLASWQVSVTLAAEAAALAVDPSDYDVLLADETFAGEHVEGVPPVDGGAEARVPLVRIGSRHAPVTHRQACRLVTTPIRLHALRAALIEAVAPESPVPGSGSAAGRPLAPVERQLDVLVVEDNDANRRIVGLMLEELGCRADLVSSGNEAIARARTHQYDVILMDVHMPGLDGLSAVRQIRAVPDMHNPLIIALTASATKEDERRCRDAGMDAYLSKPVRLDTLAAVFRSVREPAS